MEMLPVWPTSSTEPAAASTPLIANAAATTRLAAHPAQPRHPEVLGGGAHLHAEPGAAQEQRERDQQDGGRRDRDDGQPADREVRPTVTDRRNSGVTSADFGNVVNDHLGEVLQEEADRERGDQQRRRVGAAHRAERDPLHQQRQHDDDRRSRRYISRPRPALGQVDHVRADHDELAVGEVDQLHDAEDQGDAEREQRVEAARR